MKLLLDTHVFVWWLVNHKALGAKARQSIAEADKVYVSVVSAWEFFIKKALGKMNMDVDFDQAIDGESFDKINLNFDHTLILADMPAARHKDPFDRMLVAQAIAENFVLVTADKKLAAYPVKILDAER